MYFGNFRDYSVKIENYKKKKLRCLLENAGCFPSAVVIMTTTDGMHPAFRRRYRSFLKCSIFTDHYRHLTDNAEVHYTPVTLSSPY